VRSGEAGRQPLQELESSARLDPLIGTLVSGRYRIHELIASGGMGRVYRATQEQLGRQVALKVVRNDDGEDDDDALRSQQRLRVEATILAQLQHPNIVTLHDFGEVEGAFHGRSFLAMELLEGRTLQEHLDIAQRLAPQRVIAIAEQIVRGLAFAHRRGVVHRDLKPSNVILLCDDDGDETVKLVDFGIGKILEGDTLARKLTQTGAVMGTLGYIAPEQLHSRATPASDLFALGVVLFEALTGRSPFDPESTVETNGFAEPAPRLRDVASDLALPAGLESLVASLLARVPENRPTAPEVLRALAACSAAQVEPASTVIVASAEVGPVAPEPPRTRRLVHAASLVLIALLAVVPLVLLLGRSGPDRPPPQTARQPAPAPTTESVPITGVTPPAMPAVALDVPPASPLATGVLVTPPPPRRVAVPARAPAPALPVGSANVFSTSSEE
jgi:serine/threonine protein kinase